MTNLKDTQLDANSPMRGENCRDFILMPEHSSKFLKVCSDAESRGGRGSM